MRALLVSTVAKSLVFQSPTMWNILASKGYELTFAAAEDAHAEHLRSLGTFHSLQLSRDLGVGLLDGMKDLRSLSRLEWDLVQIQTPIASAAFRLSQGTPREFPLYIAHGLHCTLDFPRWKSSAFARIESALMRRTKAIGVVSQEDFELAKALGWGNEALVWRLPGAGVNTTSFTNLAGPSRERRFAVYIGELNKNKRIDFAVGVAKELISRGHVDAFVVVGDGPQAGLLDCGVNEGWIEHFPFRNDIPAVLSGASVLLHTSVREGLPRVIIEAQAAGVPVLARSNRGSRELVTPGTGLVFEPSASAQQWAEAYGESKFDPVVMHENARDYDTSVFNESYSELVDVVASGPFRGYVDRSI